MLCRTIVCAMENLFIYSPPTQYAGVRRLCKAKRNAFCKILTQQWSLSHRQKNWHLITKPKVIRNEMWNNVSVKPKPDKRLYLDSRVTQVARMSNPTFKTKWKLEPKHSYLISASTYQSMKHSLTCAVDGFQWMIIRHQHDRKLNEWKFITFFALWRKKKSYYVASFRIIPGSLVDVPDWSVFLAVPILFLNFISSKFYLIYFRKWQIYRIVLRLLQRLWAEWVWNCFFFLDIYLKRALIEFSLDQLFTMLLLSKYFTNAIWTSASKANKYFPQYVFFQTLTSVVLRYLSYQEL